MRSANLIENEIKNSDFNDINVENISEMRFKKMNIKYENIVEMIRRLRDLGQPAKLFGEDVRTLQIRLLKAEAEIKNKENILMEIQKEEKERLKSTFQEIKQKELEDKNHYKKKNRNKQKKKIILSNFREINEKKINKDMYSNEKFKSQTLVCTNIESKMCLEDRCVLWIKKLCNHWKRDLLLRPPEIAESIHGRKAYSDYNTSKRAFRYLFGQLKSRTIMDDVLKGIWLMIQAMKARNYMHANAVLLNAIAIGNAPWPIGVTQVGIHTKSAAREKISTSHLNKNAAAHIMGNEATRKYLHGLKRLITHIQRIFPTDPSRSVEFLNEIDPTKGVKGLGSTKLSLVEAEQKGEIIRPAPHQSLLQHNADGSIKVPNRLSQILKQIS